jgi:hypothetical protein
MTPQGVPNNKYSKVWLEFLENYLFCLQISPIRYNKESFVNTDRRYVK